MLSSATVVPGERTIVFVQKKATATWLKRELRYSVCLLYWYKSTNTDAAHRPTGETIAEVGLRYSVDWLQVLTLLALMVQTYKY